MGWLDDPLGALKTTMVAGRHHDKLMEFKKQMLKRLSPKQIRTLADNKGVAPKEPMLYDGYDRDIVGNKIGKRKKWVATNEDYVEVLFDKIPATDIIDFCRQKGWSEIENLARGREEYIRKNNIDDTGKALPIDENSLSQPEPSQDIQPTKSIQQNSQPVEATATAAPSPPQEVQRQVVTQAEKYNPSPFCEELIQNIKKMRIIRDFKDENELHIALQTYLDGKYEEKVISEPDRGIADLQVGNIAIELKNYRYKANRGSDLMRLATQMNRYADRYEAYLIVIYGGTEADRNQIVSDDRTARKNVRIILLG